MATPHIPVARPSNWNLPNLITVVRILLAPLFIWMLLADAGHDGALRWAAAALFIVAIATDGIDGAIARRHNLVTDLGKLLDPIADKVLAGGALVCLSIRGELPGAPAALAGARRLGALAQLGRHGARPRAHGRHGVRLPPRGPAREHSEEQCLTRRMARMQRMPRTPRPGSSPSSRPGT